MKPKLNNADFEWAAQALNCEVAAIKAVDAIESLGAGFLPDGQPVILFEAHVFDRLTGGKYRATHPNISSKSWNRKLYGPSGDHQHRRLQQASALNRLAALQSASWGRFQIMGFNHKLAGHEDVQSFINAMYASERKQLEAFVAFLKSSRLDVPLRNKQWARFAQGYNGAGYAQNQYDVKLRKAYERFSK